MYKAYMLATKGVRLPILKATRKSGVLTRSNGNYNTEHFPNVLRDCKSECAIRLGCLFSSLVARVLAGVWYGPVLAKMCAVLGANKHITLLRFGRTKQP